MAKKTKAETLIDEEIRELENKVKEFQDYLRINSIVSTISNNKSIRNDELDLTLEDQDKLHKEIVIQIKMQDAVFNWLPLLRKLRESEADLAPATRGDVEVSSMFKNKQDGK